MHTMFRHFTRTHFKILLGFVLVFSALSAFWLSQQSVGDRRDNANLATVAFTFLGPFAGAIARHFQSCCWKFSVGLFPFCAAFLLVGVVCQVIPVPFRHGQHFFRLATWTLALAGWFLGAPVSFLHALS